MTTRKTLLDYRALLQACTREKDKTKILILRYIADQKTATRKSLIESLHIRPSTVSKSVGELLENRLVNELNVKVNSGRGRPEWLLSINANRFWVVSFSIMSMSLTTTITNFGGEVVEQLTQKLPQSLTEQTMVQTLNTLIEECALKTPEGTDLLGYGVAVPGLIDKKAKLWHMASRFPAMKNLKFESITGFSEGNVLFERNIDAILNYCLLSNPHAYQKNSLLLHWGYGIAISFSAFGTPLQSEGGLFGEIGQWLAPIGIQSNQTIEDLVSVPTFMKKYDWNTTIDETSLIESIQKGYISEQKIAEIRDIIVQVLRNLHLTFFPDNIHILSPFVDKNTAAHFTQYLTEVLRPFAVKAPTIETLQYTTHSEAMGMASKLFTQSIGAYLQARW